MTPMMLMIDPPNGWMYGFPKAFTKKDDETLEEWFIQNGYPRFLIEKGYLNHCRMFEVPLEDNRYLESEKIS